MEKNDFFTWIVPRYKHSDPDGYDYGVKFPNYLSFTGNMSVGLPDTDGNLFTDFLVIWPKAFRGYEYGVSLTVEGQTYQIYINSDGSAVDPEYKEIAESCKDEINALLQRAEEMWNFK